MNLNNIALPIYCERGSSLLFTAEPVNTISNLIFFIVAYQMFQLLKRHQVRDIKLTLLAALSILIGLGSTLFHIFHTPFTLILDALPIYVSMLLFLFTFLVFSLKNHLHAVLATVLVLAIQAVLYLKGFQNLANVSVRHLVNAIAFPALLILGFKKYGAEVIPLLVAFIFYASAILLRFLEPTICPFFPIGTHFTWHIFNALVLYFGFKFLISIRAAKL